MEEMELEIIKSNIKATDYEAKVVRLINAILEAERLLALQKLKSSSPDKPEVKEAA